MATEKELGLRVEDFFGVNAAVDSTDLEDQFYKTSQNLWERKIGELQPIGGSSLLTDTTKPSNITHMRETGVIYNPQFGKRKLLKVACTDQSNTQINDANVALTYENPGTGSWGSSWATIVDAKYGAYAIQAVAVGFGIHCKLNNEVSVDPTAGSGRLVRLAVSAAVANTNIKSIEIYAKVKVGFNGATPLYAWIFVAAVDLQKNPTGTWDFSYAPVTLTTDPGAPQPSTYLGAPTDISATSLYNASGTLVPGKTYYVCGMGLDFTYLSTVTAENYCLWKAATGNVKAVTIQAGHNSISYSAVATNAAATLICIGDSPRTMRPYAIMSNGTGTKAHVILSTNSAITQIHYKASESLYIFRTSDFPRDSMLASLSGSDWRCIPICNWSGGYNFGTTESENTLLRCVPYGSAPFNVATGVTRFCVLEDIAQGYSPARWSFANHSYGGVPFVFMCPNRIDTEYPNSTYITPKEKIFQTDGVTCGVISPDSGSAQDSTLKPTLMFSYKDRLAFVAGNKIYFSLAFNPYNFGVPGESTTFQYVEIGSAQDNIVGLGVYTNTTGTSGPFSQLMVGKYSGLWIMTDWPVYSTTSKNNSVLNHSSQKVGVASHEVIVNTDVGLIVTSPEGGVYLVREEGEPTPVGEAVRYLIRPEDPTATVDTSNWSAVFHDGHYKLAYSAGGSATPNRELWLDLRKMKAMKGQPCWNGPHVGREIWSQCTEERFGDTIQPKRIFVDKTNLRWAEGDKLDVATHFGTSLAFSFETKDFTPGETNMNHLHTRTHWKLKADTNLEFTETTYVTNENGIESEAVIRRANKVASHTGGSYTTFLNCPSKIYEFFPESRLRGEKIRKKFEYTGTVRFSISGIAVFYRDERRRVS